MTHIVMTGTDVSMYSPDQGSETLQRLSRYAETLASLQADARLTYIAIGAPRNSKPIHTDRLSIIPLTFLAGLYGCLKRLAPVSLISPQTMSEQCWVAYVFAMPRRIPVVPQEHGDPFDVHRYTAATSWKRLLHRLRDRLSLYLLRLAAGMRVVSPAVAGRLEHHLPGKPLAVLPVPVSMNPLPRQESVPILLFTGRLDKGKNVDGVLKVAAALAATCPDLQVEIAGDGPQRRELEHLAQTLRIASRVCFHGWVRNEELAACYARATVFLFPTWHEAFGRVILEALICGVPVISSHAAGPGFILGQDQSGLLFDADDIEGMAAAVGDLLDNPEKREDMRQRGYKTAQRFSRDALSRSWMQFLLAIAGKARIS